VFYYFFCQEVGDSDSESAQVAVGSSVAHRVWHVLRLQLLQFKEFLVILSIRPVKCITPHTRKSKLNAKVFRIKLIARQCRERVPERKAVCNP